MFEPILRSVTISNFRRLRGMHKLPLDAPIVLIFGQNGTGKTSILSAIELALTGEIKSMRRHDKRYTAHLPRYGEAFATLSVEIADRNSEVRPQTVMTVGGNEIEGPPALSPKEAQFYAERAYLDQVSLGQLLELYQYTERNEESSLARFVNELLGLDQLDALRSGLLDATHLTKFKKLSEAYTIALEAAKGTKRKRDDASAELEGVNTGLTRLRSDVKRLLPAAGYEIGTDDWTASGRQVRSLLADDQSVEETEEAQERIRSLTELGGLIKGLSTRTGVTRLKEAKAASTMAEAQYKRWRNEYEGPLGEVRREAAKLGLESSIPPQVSLETEIERWDRQLARQQQIADKRAELTSQVADLVSALTVLDGEIAQREVRAGSLASGLALFRDEVTDDLCPVCDRDYSELGKGHLHAHIERKINEITTKGRELVESKEQRGLVRIELGSTQRELATLEGKDLPEEALKSIASRRAKAIALRGRLESLADVIETGAALRRRMQRAQADAEELEGLEHQTGVVMSMLREHASALGTTTTQPDETMERLWRRVSDLAAQRMAEIRNRKEAREEARATLARIDKLEMLAKQLTVVVAQRTQEKRRWDQQITEANRRRNVARQIHKAASDTRAAIVERVFTKSLNTVWHDVFVRLAPSEPFVPAFGIPTSTRTSLQIQLETIHRSGGKAGTPATMLSSGNLNTAALSLFIALHLAVEPLVPCLVFDDPVQSMDEVHVAQLAGLLRVLSKHHNRQIVVAVHERDLFEYLALELSPAFEGDKLITIELGHDDSSEGAIVKRRTWIPDQAVAVKVQ